MSKPKMIGYFKPYTPNGRAGRNTRKAPWQGGYQKPRTPESKNKEDSK